jgi:ABC-type amino acid transport system permease subunit
MSPHNDLLLLAGRILTVILQALVGIGAVAIAIALPVLVFARSEFLQGLSDGLEVDLANLPLGPLMALLAILLLVLAAMFVFFGKLRAIINTVGEGEPFVPANAERLNLMAWLMLGAQVLLFPAAWLAEIVASWANEIEDMHLSVDHEGLDLTGILMVLVLFILARVFRHGAAMREDLEGTV